MLAFKHEPYPEQQIGIAMGEKGVEFLQGESSEFESSDASP